MTSRLKPVTVYLDPEIHLALRRKVSETDRSMSDLVNEAVRTSLAEDAEDLAAFEERATEARIPFKRAVRQLKRRGKV